MRNISTYICILFCVVASNNKAGAQPFSYIYIQGDKEIPFYVKMEGEMMPRYGKNYYILAELTPGKKNIEILFQQRAYPSRKFTIDVPENGYRGFLIDRHDSVVALYDLQHKNYIKSIDSN